MNPFYLLNFVLGGLAVVLLGPGPMLAIGAIWLFAGMLAGPEEVERLRVLRRKVMVTILEVFDGL